MSQSFIAEASSCAILWSYRIEVEQLQNLSKYISTNFTSPTHSLYGSNKEQGP